MDGPKKAGLVYQGRSGADFKMAGKNYRLEFLILALLLTVTSCKEEILYSRSFENTGVSGFNAIDLSPIDGKKFLAVASNEKVWKEDLNCRVKKDSTLSWYWTGSKEKDYTFLVKLVFSGHKVIYYVAMRSRNPVAQGERYRSKDGRMRFSPSVIICGLPFSSGNWVNIKRDIGSDYSRHCGVLSKNVRLKQIEILMKTEAELGIDNIVVKG